MKNLSNQKIITCLLPKEHSKAHQVAKLLHDEKGIHSTSIESGRGSRFAKSVSQITWVEVDILTVILSEEEAQDIFHYILEKADLSRPHSGFIYQGDLLKVTPFTLPDLPEEDVG
jgi:hypothetical protein